MNKALNWLQEQFSYSGNDSNDEEWGEEMVTEHDLLVDQEDYIQQQEEKYEIENRLKSQYSRRYDGNVESVFGFFESYAESLHQAESLTKSTIKEGVTEDELGFLNFIVEEDLDSATRDGMTIIDHASSFEFRTNGDSKVLDGKTCELLREVFGEDEESFKEKTRKDWSYGTSNSTSISFTTKSGGGGGSTEHFGQSRLKTADIHLELDEEAFNEEGELKLKGIMNE